MPLALVLLAQLHLLFRTNLNWDEFFYLARVYEFLRGEPVGAWQQFHVHLFGWLARVPGNEVAQLHIARLTAFGAQLVTVVFGFLVARRFIPGRHAAFGLLAVLSSDYVLRHGVSFRTDPYCVALFFVALYLVQWQTRRRLALAAAGAAAALMVLLSLKSVFLVAVLFLVLALQRRVGRSRTVTWQPTMVFAAAFMCFLGILFLYHQSTQAAEESAALAMQPVGLSDLASRFLLPETLFPRRHFLLTSLQQTPLLWLSILGGLAWLLFDVVRSPGGRHSSASMLPLALPLLTLAFYRNAFPYYYVFVLFPAAVFAGLFLLRLEAWCTGLRRGRVIAMVPLLLWGGILITIATSYLRYLPDQTRAQRQLIEVVHRIFPEPVAYIDRCSMISSFPKVGFFMSTLGLERYWALGRPVMEDLLRQHQPVFLVVNSPGLAIYLPEEVARRRPYALRPEDREVLRASFVHHWEGRIFVAGKDLVAPGERSIEFDVLIEGLYTVESGDSVVLNGSARHPGEVVWLAQGRHRLEGGSAGERVILRWGDRLPRPVFPAVPQQLFTGL